MSDPIDFSERAHLDEEMDGACSYEELRECLRDLAVVNRLTRAHRPILQWLDRLFRARAGRRDPLRIVDFCCGYGDMLRRIERLAATRGVPVDLIGADINPNAIRAAREATPAGSRIVWAHGDMYSSAEVKNVDVVTTCGVLHHLTEDEIVRFLRWSEENTRVGWFVVDLHRKPVPYYVFSMLMRGGWWHRFIRPDGLRSIRRSFLAEDWQRMCRAAGIDLRSVRIEEHRPARLCVERLKSAPE